MIDHLEKQTQLLTLEQPKRGRGRPATGTAMTPAEKQKAYRERQKKEAAADVIARGDTSELAKQYGNVLRRKLESLDGDVESFGLFIARLIAEQ